MKTRLGTVVTNSMNRNLIFVSVLLLIISLTLISCISINVKNEQPLPQFVEVALITPTREVTAVTFTNTPLPTTPAPSPTFMVTHSSTPTITQTVMDPKNWTVC